MSGSGRQALQDVWEWSGVPPGCNGSGLESLLDVQEWSGGFPGYLGVVKRPSRMSGSSREAHPEVQE